MGKNKISKLLALLFTSLLIFTAISQLFAEQGVILSFKPASKVRIIKISNITKKVNGSYIGLQSSEEKTIVNYSYTAGAAKVYEGQNYLSQTLKHDARFVEKPLESIEPVKIYFQEGIFFSVPEGQVFPSYINFPVFPATAVKKGDTWEAWSERYIDPMDKGIYTKVRFICEYKYEGLIERGGKMVHYISAQYAFRYEAGDDPYGDPDLLEIHYAGHWVDIYMDAEDQGNILIIDKLGVKTGYQEEYWYKDGTKLVLSGNMIIMIGGVAGYDHSEVEEDVTEEIENNDIDDVDVTDVDEGIKLTLKSIHFYPDSAKILPDEKNRLDNLAELLKKYPDKTFLVIGHTADFGSKESQDNLSLLRAKTIVDELIKRGIPAKQFSYIGKGSRESIAPNDTEENMAKNRRVEIIILDE